jgi:hypothetical protein
MADLYPPASIAEQQQPLVDALLRLCDKIEALALSQQQLIAVLVSGELDQSSAVETVPQPGPAEAKQPKCLDD